MKRQIMVILALVLMLSIFLVACDTGKSPDGTGSAPSTEDPIKIGLIQPITGPIAATGIAIRDGALIYQDYINSKGGVHGRPIQLVVQDGANDPTMSANAMSKLCSDNDIPVVIGSWGSSPTLASIEISRSNGMPQIVETASNWKITDKDQEGGPTVFRLSAPSMMEIVALEPVLIDDLKFNKPYLIGANNDWGRGNAAEFEHLYGSVYSLSIAGSDFIDPAETEFSSVLTRVLDTDADSIIYTGDAAQCALVIEQARNLGMNVPFLGMGMACSLYKISDLIGMKAAEGYYQTASFAGTVDASLAAASEESDYFIEQWEKQGHEYIELQEAARGWDAVKVACEAIKLVDKDSINRESVGEALTKVKTTGIAYGNINFTDWGNFINQNIAPITVIGIRNGEATVIVEPTYAEYSDKFPWPTA